GFVPLPPQVLLSPGVMLRGRLPAFKLTSRNIVAGGVTFEVLERRRLGRQVRELRCNFGGSLDARGRLGGPPDEPAKRPGVELAGALPGDERKEAKRGGEVDGAPAALGDFGRERDGVAEITALERAVELDAGIPGPGR